VTLLLMSKPGMEVNIEKSWGSRELMVS